MEVERAARGVKLVMPKSRYWLAFVLLVVLPSMVMWVTRLAIHAPVSGSTFFEQLARPGFAV